MHVCLLRFGQHPRRTVSHAPAWPPSTSDISLFFSSVTTTSSSKWTSCSFGSLFFPQSHHSSSRQFPPSSTSTSTLATLSHINQLKDNLLDPARPAICHWGQQIPPPLLDCGHWAPFAVVIVCVVQLLLSLVLSFSAAICICRFGFFSSLEYPIAFEPRHNVSRLFPPPPPFLPKVLANRHNIRKHTHTHTHIRLHIYAHKYPCPCPSSL